MIGHVDGGGARQRRSRRVEVDGDGRAIAGCGRVKRGRGRHAALPAIMLHENVLDIRLFDVTAAVIRLDVIIKQLAAETGHVGIGDLGKVVIGDDGVGPIGRVEHHVINLAVVRLLVERGAGLGQFALGHGDGDPRADIAAAGVGFVLGVGHGVDAVVVNTDFHADVGDAVDVVGVGPNIEFGVHLLEETFILLRDAVVPAKGVAAGIVGKALGLQDGWRRGVLMQARGHEALELADGILGGEGRLDFIIVAEAAIIIETGIQAGQINVPGQFDIVGAGPVAVAEVVVRILHLPRLHAAAFILEDLLGGDDPVGARHQRRIAEELEREARRFQIHHGVGVARGDTVRIHRRLDPLEEVRRAVVHFRENPCAIFHVRDGGVGLGRIDEPLRRVLDVAGVGRVVEELRGGLLPRAKPAAPGVVAVGGRHHNDRAVGVGGVGGDVGLDFADSFVGVAEAVAQHIVRGHHINLFGCAAVRVDPLGLVQLIGKGRHVPCRVAGIGFAVPPALGGRGAKQVGLVGRRRENAVLPGSQIELVEIGRARAAQVVAGHNGPLVAFVHQHINQRLRERHFSREIALGVVAEVRIAAPRLPPRLLENLQLFAKNFLGQ